MVVAATPHAAEDGAEARRSSTTSPTPAVSSTRPRSPRTPPRVHDEAPATSSLDARLRRPTPSSTTRSTTPRSCVEDHASGRLTALPLEARACVAEWDDRDERLIAADLDPGARTWCAPRVADAACACPSTACGSSPPTSAAGSARSASSRARRSLACGRRAAAAPPGEVDRGPPREPHRRLPGREQRYHVRAGFDAEGRCSALDADIAVRRRRLLDCYPFTCGVEPLMAADRDARALRGPRLPGARPRAVTTNKAPMAPYRGVSPPADRARRWSG